MNRVLFHIHSNLSSDSILSRKKIYQFCRNHNIKYLIPTDHDCFFVKNVEQTSFGTVILPACEFSTTSGDLIGIFFKALSEDDIFQMLREKKINALADKIRSSDGITVLPHPYARHKLHEINLEKIDVMEVHNSRYSIELSNKAMMLAQKSNKPMVVGSDAHLESELGNALNYTSFQGSNLRELFENLAFDSTERFTSMSNKCFSMLVLALKSKRVGDVIKYFIFFIINILKRK